MSADISPGEWWLTERGHVRNKSGFICSLPIVQRYEGQDKRYEKEKLERAANAQLFIEAGNVTSETGLTPRQLADQRAELLAVLVGLVEIIEKAGLRNLANGVQLGQVSWLVKATDRVDDACAVIAKATGEGA